MEAVHRDLVPEGTLRAAVNFGNAVVVQRDALSGQPRGLAVELADELARRLEVPCMVLGFDGVTHTAEAGLAGAWDVAFLAVNPARADRFDFTEPYVTLEGTFVVRDGSPWHTALDLDHEGVRIAVAQDGVYDEHLTRTLHHATVVRVATVRGSVERFLADRLDAVAGQKQPLAAFARSHGGLHTVEGRFAAVEQAIMLRKGHAAGLRYLNAFVKDMRDSGRVAAAMQRTGDLSATVAPRAILR